MATAGFGAPPVEAAYSRARELSQQIGDTPGRFPALFGLWLFYWGRGEVQTADGLARDLRRRAGRDPDLRLQAAHSSWSTAFSRGAFAETRRHARTADGALRPRSTCRDGGDVRQPRSCGLRWHVRRSRVRDHGPRRRVDRLGEEAVTLARSLDHPFSLGLALTFRAASAQALGDHDAATVNADEATTIAREQGFRLMLGWCLAVSGWAAVQRGEVTAEGRGSTRRSRPRAQRDRISSCPTSWRRGRRRTSPPVGPPTPSRPRATALLRSLAPPSGSTRPSSTVSRAKRCLPRTGASAASSAFRKGGGRRNPARGEPLCASLSRPAGPVGGRCGRRSRPARRRARQRCRGFRAWRRRQKPMPCSQTHQTRVACLVPDRRRVRATASGVRRTPGADRTALAHPGRMA